MSGRQLLGLAFPPPHLAVTEDVEAGALTQVTHTPVVLDQGSDFGHHDVGAVPRLELAELLHLILVHDVGSAEAHAGRGRSVSCHQRFRYQAAMTTSKCSIPSSRDDSEVFNTKSSHDIEALDTSSHDDIEAFDTKQP